MVLVPTSVLLQYEEICLLGLIVVVLMESTPLFLAGKMGESLLRRSFFREDFFPTVGGVEERATM